MATDRSSSSQAFFPDVSSKTLRRAAIAFVAVCSVFFFVQAGMLNDEAEHAHVAWLIGAKGWQPLRDFFQHHMRLLWDVLALYPMAGGGGPQTLLFGRFLVLLCGFALLAGLWFLARQRHAEGRRAEFAFVAALAFLGNLAVNFREAFVLRPETLAAPMVIWACALWVLPAKQSSDRDLLDLASGLLLGAAFSTTPRSLFFAMIFPLLAPPGTGAIEKNPRRYLLTGLAAMAFFGIYYSLYPLGIEYPIYAMRISSKIQRVDAPTGFPAPFQNPLHSTFLLILCVPWLLWRSAADASRPAMLRWLRLGVFFFFLVLALCVPHVYSWNWEFFALAATVFVVEYAAQAAAQAGARTAVALALIVASVESASIGVIDIAGGYDVFTVVARRGRALARLGPGDTVMMSYFTHPIAAVDASYYGGYFADNYDRLCRTVKAVPTHFQLPPCDFLSDFERLKPRLTDVYFEHAVPITKAIPASKQLYRLYYQVPEKVADHTEMLTIVFERRPEEEVERAAASNEEENP